MVFWWFSYCINDRPLGVVIIQASTLEHARMIATIKQIDAGMTFTEGHMLDEQQSPLLKPARLAVSYFCLGRRKLQRGSLEGCTRPGPDGGRDANDGRHGLITDETGSTQHGGRVIHAGRPTVDTDAFRCGKSTSLLIGMKIAWSLRQKGGSVDVKL